MFKLCYQAFLKFIEICAIVLDKILPLISKLLNDSNRQIQQQTDDTLIEIYRRFGENVWTCISKDNVPGAR
ncbi:unnamed protein product, partial [Didymodactylos carnosus]